MWNLRNLTEDHGGSKGKKIGYKLSGREARHKGIKYREQTEGGWGGLQEGGESGLGALRRALVGMSTDYRM